MAEKSLTDQQREALAAAYRYLLRLAAKRRAKAAASAERTGRDSTQ